MKRTALLLTLLLSIPMALAASTLFDIDLSDGRKCKVCTFELKQGFIVSVKDAGGVEWLDITKPMTAIVSKSGQFSWNYHTYTTPAGEPKELPPISSASEAEALGIPTWSEFKPLLDIGLPYWTKRKAQFDQELALCGVTTTDKAMCYMQVRQIEAQKSSMHRLQRSLP